MSSSGNPQLPVNTGPDKVIWVKIKATPGSDNQKRVYFESKAGNGTSHFGWFELDSQSATDWARHLASSMSTPNNDPPKVTFDADSSMQITYAHTDLIGGAAAKHAQVAHDKVANVAPSN